MIKRKIIQIADSTMLVSLPREWAKKNNLKKGDELELTAEEQRIIITSGVSASRVCKADIDVARMDRTSIMLIIRSLYRLGYDEIRMHFNKNTAYHYRTKSEKKITSIIHEEVRNLTGFEVMQQKEDFCEIKDMLEISRKEFDTAMRRVFMLFVDSAKDISKGFKEDNKIIIEAMEEKNETMIKFISYCLRILNKAGHESSKKSKVYYHIIASFDIISDIFKYMAREYLACNRKMSSHTIKTLENLTKALVLFHEFFYKFDTKKVVEFMEIRDVIKKSNRVSQKTATQQEIALLNSAEQILEIIKDLVEARLGLEFCNE